MLVSVAIITYKHEKFIKEAIEGVLMQEGEFDIELIIANDRSPDKTDQIIKEIINKHARGEIIRYYNHRENIGMINNFLFTLQMAKGQYIALCEGDDFWTDPLKLQKQVNFLEANPNFSFCFHNANTLFCDTGLIKPFNQKLKSGVYTAKDLLLKGWIIPTASLLFRSKYLPTFIPDWFYSVKSGDYALELLLSMQAPIYYMDETMSVYRKNAENSASLNLPSAIVIVKNQLSLLKNFKKLESNKYLFETNLAIAKSKYDLCKVYIYKVFPFLVTMKNKIFHN